MIPLLALLACSSPDPAPEQVLYLRQAQPSAGSAFGRVNPRTFDLGSLSTQPPTSMELRACGDVVAYAGQPELLAADALGDDPIEVREVLYRLWWTSGVGRGVLSLWAPGQGGGLAQEAVSSCAVPSDDPRHDNGFFRTTARVAVNRTLSPEDLAGLHLLLDVASAQVVVGSCSDRSSLLVLNPPSDAILAKRDSDGDGVSDLDELQGSGDPWRADDGGAGASCLHHADPVAELPACPVPEPPREQIALPELDGEQTWSGRSLQLQGHLRVQGKLVIDGGTVLFAPGSDGRAGLELAPGASLDVRGGAVLGAADPAVGFSLLARPDSRLRIVDSTLQHVGSIVIDDNGYASSQGIVVETPAAELHGNTFRWGLGVLEIMADDVAITGNRFEHDGLAVLIHGKRTRVEDNHSIGGGLFVRVDGGGDDSRIVGNHLERTVDIGIKVMDQVPGVVIESNRLENVHQGVEFRRVKELTLRNNTVQACIQPFLPLLDEAPPGVVAEGNTIEPGDPSVCRITAPSNQPDHYPGDVRAPGAPQRPPPR